MNGKYKDNFEDHFHQLVLEVTSAIKRNKEDGTSQEDQVEELLDAERKFKDTILQYRQATEIYKKFTQKICVKNKNILSARPYFRENSITFSKQITPAFKSNDLNSLKKFNVNYQFIKFAKDSWLGPFPKRAEQLFQRVFLARTKLIENNMPLAINRAKLFFRKTPKSHLTLMDMIGLSSAGLAEAVDKWCGKYSPVFRGVIIGRAVGKLIDAYSEKVLHFYPKEMRILYTANSIKGRRGIEDIDELTNAVNEFFIQQKNEGSSTVPTTTLDPSTLANLMNASSMVSADSALNEEGFTLYDYAMDPKASAEDNMIEKESMGSLFMAIKVLPLIHRKVLKLMGVGL